MLNVLGFPGQKQNSSKEATEINNWDTSHQSRSYQLLSGSVTFFFFFKYETNDIIEKMSQLIHFCPHSSLPRIPWFSPSDPCWFIAFPLQLWTSLLCADLESGFSLPDLSAWNGETACRSVRDHSAQGYSVSLVAWKPHAPRWLL